MTRRLLLVLGTVAMLLGCGAHIPADPDGTLEDVRGSVLRVGVSAHPPWTTADPEPEGIEAELAREFAATLDAEVEWVHGGEEALMGQLERGEIDLVIGGLTAKSPWSQQAALTRAYLSLPGATGGQEQHVMAVPMGENAFLVELERFLLDQEIPL